MPGDRRGRAKADRLAVIAGSGRLPEYVAEAAKAAGDDPFILMIDGEADGDWSAYDQAAFVAGDFATLKAIIEREGIGRIVMSGGVNKRPSWRALRPTFATLTKLPAALKALFNDGDDKVLRFVIEIIETTGCRVIGAQDIVPGIVTEIGSLTKVEPTAEQMRHIAVGARAARLLGDLDVGQGVVVVGHRVVALEGPEGTDAMLGRVAALKAEGRVSTRHKGALVKCCKPRQELRADLPTIGPVTVRGVLDAGLAGIAIEAGRSIILDREAVVEAANAGGLFIVGIDADNRTSGT